MSEQPLLYAQQRAREIGLTDDKNIIQVFLPGETEPVDRKLLASDGTKHDNLAILFLALEKRGPAYVAMTHETTVVSSFTEHESITTVPFYTYRLKKPLGKIKYRNPDNVPAMPYLPPMLIDAYAARMTVPLLILTEGPLKALKGTLHGLYTIGMNGIWGMRAKEEKGLHPIIRKIVEACNVQSLVYLQDNDFREVQFSYGKDLAERPAMFSAAVMAFQKACQKLKNKKLRYFFGHTIERGPKGLDDVLVANKGREDEVVADLLQLTEARDYFTVIDLQEDFYNMAEVKRYFRIDSAEMFYQNHSSILEDKDFIFQGDWYKFNEEEDVLDLKLPGIVMDYLLIGNKYYKKIYELNSKGHPEPVREIRNSEIIIDDFRRLGKSDKEAKELMFRIPKYEGYVNEPDFIQYTPEIIIHDRFRMYNLTYRLEHEPAPGDWPHIELFLRHIFANGGDDKYEVGMDMIQMYYTLPCQKQRIISLVSAANETGKTLFLELMRAIFGQNMSIIGQADLESQFNPYVTKSLIGVDESKIEDVKIIEKLKSMVTNAYAVFNDKGMSAKSVLNRAKLIMTTNHIFDFAKIDSQENKWFVVEVGQVKRKDKDLMAKMIMEIPAFLHFLQNRQLLHYTNESRFAILDKVVETEALRRIKKNSKPPLIGMINDYLSSRFKEYDEPIIKIDATRLYEQVFPERSGAAHRFSHHDILRAFVQEYGLETPEKSLYFKVPKTELVSEEKTDEDTGEVTEAAFKTTWNGYRGKAVIFNREDFS